MRAHEEHSWTAEGIFEWREQSNTHRSAKKFGTGNWRAWRGGLWRTHATLFLCVSVAILVIPWPNSMPRFRDFIVAMLAGVACIAWLPVYPMVRFKTQMRTLTIDAKGISTTIGKKSESRAWTEIQSVQSEQGAIVITGRNKNAFIVPRRAFDSDRDQKEFLLYPQQAFRSAKHEALIS
jgi:hypothetical protein